VGPYVNGSRVAGILRQPHPPFPRDGTVLAFGRIASCATVLATPRAAGSGGDAESGGSLRSVGEISAQRAVDQV
jgi:hypothetical protein